MRRFLTRSRVTLMTTLYYNYPYVIIITSLMSCAAHYAFKLDQSIKSLLVTSLTD